MDQKTINLVKKIILGVFIFFMLLPMFGLFLVSCEDDTSTVKNTIEPTVKTTPKITVKTTPLSSKKPKPVDTRLNIDIAMDILKNSYKGIADVKYISKDKIIEIKCTDKNFMYGVLYAKQGQEANLKQWNILVEALKDTSKTIDKDIMIALVNNMNTSNYIYSCQNGITIYDYVNN